MGEEASVKFEQALSGRSTCRATGEKIDKGEWRVGLEVWISGRVATAWTKPLPFLKDCCHLEYALNPSTQQGSCRATGAKFARGDVRFVATAGDPSKKLYLSLAAAGAALRPVLQHVGGGAFRPCQLAGLEALAAKDRAAFFQAFEVSKDEAERFDAEHPPLPPPSLEKPAAKGKGRGKEAKAEEKEEGEEEELQQAEQGEQKEGEAEEGRDGGAAAEGGQRPAKRAKRGGRESAAESAGGGSRGSAGGDGGEAQGMTELERQRAQLIARNRERLMALNLPGMAAELLPQPQRKAPAAAQHKGVSRKRLSEVLPRRESSRLRGIAADGSQVHSERHGEVVVVAGEVIRRYASGTMTEEQEPQERHPQGELPFESSNCGHATDEAFIQLLAHAAASANSGAAPGSPRKGAKAAGSKAAAGGKGAGGKGGAAAGSGAIMKAAEMKRLQLAPDDVAKVTKDATTHLAFHPITDTLIIACADKKGNVGLWHVNEGQYELPSEARPAEPILKRPSKASERATEQAAADVSNEQGGQAATSGAVSLDGSAAAGTAASADSSGGSGGAFDGVVALQPPHYEYICGLKWAGGSGRGASLFTASYDGSLRRLDVERGISELVVSSEDAEYSCMDVTGDGRTALLGDNEGALVLVDTRQAQRPATDGGALTVHGKKINTVSIEPLQEQVFATASTDTSIRLWDLRAWGKGAKPVATAGHSQACQAALFAPHGSRRLVSTSFDNTVRVWDGGAGLAQRLSIKHDNNTGRWVLPFRAVWTPAADGVIVGNMKRFVDIFDAQSGGMLAQLSSEHMTAIASRNAVHPAGLPVLASATNSGRIHVYRR
ncbi:hypothetical protein ABPG75_000405 [Micractinium tetrahymenae]